MHTRTDAELLNDYASRGDDAAFGELVFRHGAFVHRTCFRLLKDEHEAQDACQTVFLVLAQKARRLRGGDLSAWLYRVGHLVAAETARKRMRRAQREERYAADDAGGGEAPVTNEIERQAVLNAVDAELMALSVSNREAVLLRYLRGHSQEEAARLAGCSITALASRASRGIEEIRRRLARRGIVVGVPILAAALESEAQAAIPEALLSSTMTALKAYAAGTAATHVAALTKGVLNMMFWNGVKTAAAVAATVVLAGGGAIVAQEVAQRKAAERPAPPAVQRAAADDSGAKAPEAMYWLGESHKRPGDLDQAYRVFKALSLDHPESNWAKYARAHLAALLTLKIPFMEKAPACDGLLGSGEWDTASRATGFFDARVLAPGVSTGASLRVVQPQLHLGYDKENLYVACELPISPADYRLRHEAKSPDVLEHPQFGLMRDDYVRLEICPCADPAAGAKYGSLNLQWNAIGTVADWCLNPDGSADMKWSSGGTLRTVAGPLTHWVSEWTIPLTALRYGRYAATDAKGTAAAKLPPEEASIWRLRLGWRMGETSDTLAVVAFFPDYEIPAWPANQPLPAAEAALLSKAEERYAAKAYAEALTQYSAFATQFPKSAASSLAFTRKGRCLQMLGNTSEAIKACVEARDFFPDQVAQVAPALLWTAQCYYLRGDVKQAMKALAELSADKDYAKDPAAAGGKRLLEGIQVAN